ncbi:MAG: stage III sporulation protein AA [Bacillus sp. (in: firmicutes)]
MQSIFTFLPQKLGEVLQRMPQTQIQLIEEIRIRIGRPVEISAGNQFDLLPVVMDEEDAMQLLNKLTQFSMYTMEEELKRGYITIEGGHRVGIAGKVILEQGHVKAIAHISSFNIRIAKERVGCAAPLISCLYKNGWQNTMIIGPPQSGKTTLLRDLARIISSGVPERSLTAVKVGIVDERSEIAGCVRGVPQLQFGTRVDVLDACPKAEGMMMLIRSMSPQVIIADEIGRKEDAYSVLEAVNAGISLIISIHGYGVEEIIKRPTIKELMDLQVFSRFVVLQRDTKHGFLYHVTNQLGEKVSPGRSVKV